MHLRISHVLLPLVLILSSTSPAFAADTAPPQLIDWSNAGSADITNSDGQVKANFILSDDSEIDLPKLLLKSLTTSQMTPFATVKVIQRNGKLTSYEATVLVQRGQAPRSWEWVLYPLGDSLGNRNAIFGPGSSWSPQINIYNIEYTADTALCEVWTKKWNETMDLLTAVERKYPLDVEVSVFRMKSRTALVAKDESECSSKLKSDSGQFGVSGLRELTGATKDSILALRDAAEGRANAAADKAAADKAAADKAAADKAAADKAAADKAAAKPVTKEKTIVCTKGKSSLKVIGKNPKCPAGYKVKK